MSFIFKLLTLILSVLATRVACLSLDDIHSSSNTFKSVPLNDFKDKTLRSALDTVRRRRQEYPLAYHYGPYSLPIQAAEYYKRLEQFIKNQNNQDLDLAVKYDSIKSDIDKPSTNDFFSTALALKLSHIFDQKDEKEPNIAFRQYEVMNMKRKRSTSNHINNYGFKQQFDKNNDFKAIKQSVENIIKHKTGSRKTKTKRKSARRVLKDHFKIEENKVLKNRDNKHSTLKNSHNSSASADIPHSQSLPKHSFSSQRIAVKNMKRRDVKKSITKRKAVSPVIINNNTAQNESKIQSTQLNISDKKVMSELTDIMADENKSNKLQTKPNVVKTGSQNSVTEKQSLHNKNNMKITLIKKKNKRSNTNDDYINTNNMNNDNIESESQFISPNDVKLEEENSESDVENEWPNTKRDFDEWLRNEYYKNIAKTLATMRRKRSQNIDLITDDYVTDGSDDSINSIEDSVGDNLIAIDDSNDNKEDDVISNDSKISEKVDDESDEDYVIADPDDDDSSERDIDESLFWNDFERKNKNHKSKRSVSPYFGEIGDNDESNEVIIDSERFTHVNDKLQGIEGALINEALDLIRETARKGSQTEAESHKIENRLDAAYDIEDMRLSLDNLHKTVTKMNSENLDNGIDSDQGLDNEILIPAIQVEKTKDLDSTHRDCLALEMLSKDCSSVTDLIPNSKLKESFAESCNWHEICYTCGEAYGLLSSDCDAGFLEASRLACDGSASCEAFARLILSPLRQSRVFYKSNVPLTCYQFECIKNFLFNTQERKR